MFLTQMKSPFGVYYRSPFGVRGGLPVKYFWVDSVESSNQYGEVETGLGTEENPWINLNTVFPNTVIGNYIKRGYQVIINITGTINYFIPVGSGWQTSGWLDKYKRPILNFSNECIFNIYVCNHFSWVFHISNLNNTIINNLHITLLKAPIPIGGNDVIFYNSLGCDFINLNIELDWPYEGIQSFSNWELYIFHSGSYYFSGGNINIKKQNIVTSSDIRALTFVFYESSRLIMENMTISIYSGIGRVSFSEYGSSVFVSDYIIFNPNATEIRVSNCITTMYSSAASAGDYSKSAIFVITGFVFIADGHYANSFLITGGSITCNSQTDDSYFAYYQYYIIACPINNNLHTITIENCEISDSYITTNGPGGVSNNIPLYCSSDRGGCQYVKN